MRAAQRPGAGSVELRASRMDSNEMYQNTPFFKHFPCLGPKLINARSGKIALAPARGPQEGGSWLCTSLGPGPAVEQNGFGLWRVHADTVGRKGLQRMCDRLRSALSLLWLPERVVLRARVPEGCLASSQGGLHSSEARAHAAEYATGGDRTSRGRRDAHPRADRPADCLTLC